MNGPLSYHARSHRRRAHICVGELLGGEAVSAVLWIELFSEIMLCRERSGEGTLHPRSSCLRLVRLLRNRAQKTQDLRLTLPDNYTH